MATACQGGRRKGLGAKSEEQGARSRERRKEERDPEVGSRLPSPHGFGVPRRSVREAKKEQIIRVFVIVFYLGERMKGKIYHESTKTRKKIGTPH